MLTLSHAGAAGTHMKSTIKRGMLFQLQNLLLSVCPYHGVLSVLSQCKTVDDMLTRSHPLHRFTFHLTKQTVDDASITEVSTIGVSGRSGNTCLASHAPCRTCPAARLLPVFKL